MVLSDELTFRIIFFVLYGIPYVHFRYNARKAHGFELSIWRRIRAASKWEDKMRIALVAALPALVMGGAALAYVIYPYWMVWFTLPFPSWLRWAGVCLGVVAFVVRVWSQKVLGKEWSPYLHLIEGHRLVTDGPYRWIRHPIYATTFAFRTALILDSANLIVALPCIALMGFVYPRARKEEAMMIERFGDQYRAYMARTGRFLPQLTTKKESC